MLRDVQHALRILWQTKGWTAIVLLSLALGIGVNTTLFSAINGLLLKTLAVHEPENLVRFRWTGDNQMATSRSSYGYMEPTAMGQRVMPTFSYRVFEELQKANQSLSGMFACVPGGRVNVVTDGHAELASAFLATGSYFQVLRVPAFIGRTLLPDDDRPDAPPVGMLSYGYWERRFGSDPGVIGKTISVNGISITVVGVTPPDYTGIQRLGDSAADVHLPLALDHQLGDDYKRLERPTWWWLEIVGRLKPGITAQQVEGNLEGVFEEAARAGWESYYAGLSEDERALQRNQNHTSVPKLDVASAARGVYDTSPTSSRSISILGVVVTLILLIVCANVANLLLSRATSRQKEISIRLSVGATRFRLIRQLLTESLLMALLGGALAMAVAYWCRGLLPIPNPPPLDWSVFAFAAGVSLVTGLLFGTIPALRATRVDLAGTLKETSRSVTRSRTLLGKALAVSQVALSLILLVGAGLFLQTLANLRNVEVGFNTRQLLLVSLDATVNGYDNERSPQLFKQMQERFQAIPSVESVSYSQTALLAGSTWTSTIHLQDSPEKEGDAHMMTVSSEFFSTLGIPLLMGRGFETSDSKEAPKVALINQAAARAYFPEGSPLGRRFGFSPEKMNEVEIIGVVGDAKYSSVRDEAPPTVYQPYAQNPYSRVAFEIRTQLEPRTVVPSVREAVAQLDPNLPIGNISTQAEELEERYAQERLFAMAYTLFGALALLLACIGLFGLMSYNVSRRTNEIGIRMALGAHRKRVIGMVLKESLVLVTIGVAIGIGIALFASRLVASLLYDLAPNDPSTIVAATLLMLLVSALAGYLPAYRASRVDPMRALHHE